MKIDMDKVVKELNIKVDRTVTPAEATIAIPREVDELVAQSKESVAEFYARAMKRLEDALK